ncbi:MAG: GH36 C-terminal domain-containing protein [Spirochaetaceae bacterium]|nr:GH36 C-terminal domain-containing protein [Spirochaetaceae bacterium]
MQFGNFSMLEDPQDGKIAWITLDPQGDWAIIGYYQGLAKPNPGLVKIKPVGLKKNILYKVEQRLQYHELRQFGSLINQALPVEEFSFKALGDQLCNHGIVPPRQFFGTGNHDRLAFLGDLGSRIFIIKKEEGRETENSSK